LTPTDARPRAGPRIRREGPIVATTGTLEADLRFAHELADAAAAVTLAWFGDRLPVELKADATPVTEVDLNAERAIREAITARFPHDGVLGEEEGATDGTTGRRWIVDPVDGTKMYAEGVPLWTTLIALEIDGETVLGVADAPALGDRYHACRGKGAWRGSKLLRVSDVATLDASFVVHSGIDEWIGAGDDGRLRAVGSRARRTRGLSDAWAHLLVAQGSAEALLEHEPCHLWDWAATDVIVHEAGGRMSTLDGGPPAVGHDLLVSNGRVHDEMLAVLGTRGTTDEGTPRREAT
jgi:histidinol-phosphatase